MNILLRAAKNVMLSRDATTDEYQVHLKGELVYGHENYDEADRVYKAYTTECNIFIKESHYGYL